MDSPITYLPLARLISWQASDLIMEYYQSGQNLQIISKGAGEGDVTIADRQANDLILRELQNHLGNTECAYMSEESADNLDRLQYEWVWIIDPLDGTKGFIEHSGEFGVHIALAYRQRPVLGVVVFPAHAQLYYAVQGQGAFQETQDGTVIPIRVSDRTQLTDMTAIASRSHRTPAMEFLLEQLPKRQEQQVGGLGGKWLAIATGRVDYYLTIPGESAPKDWDFCAPEIILQEAGGRASHFDNSPILYNRDTLEQRQPIVASNGHAHEQLCQLCSQGLREFSLQLG
jgi:3'(2'), 5'-bisphosphate nucleotidase